MKRTAKAKRWNKTPVQNLVRHESGGYYARLQSGGKDIWRSLKTTLLEVAKSKLHRLLEEERTRTATVAPTSGRMMMREAEALRLRQIDNDTALKPATKHYWRQCLALLFKSWPELREKAVARISRSDCETWAGRLAEKVSPTRFNNTLSALRQLFEVAIEAGARYGDPAETVKRRKVQQKHLDLPALAEFHAWVELLRNRGGRFSKHCADFVELMAYSGTRKTEAAALRWADADFERGELLVRGDAETGTKNWTVRRVPMIAPLRDLLVRMKSERLDVQPSDRIAIVKEAQKGMDQAAKLSRMKRITHHDLRHLFATICIESGVDIPTVSRWLGHKDGGALAMKTYGHLRDEHSQGAAAKVTFGKVGAA